VGAACRKPRRLPFSFGANPLVSQVHTHHQRRKSQFFQKLTYGAFTGQGEESIFDVFAELILLLLLVQEFL